MSAARRSDYDVTNTVQVSSAAAVHAAVESLFAATWPDAPLDPVAHAFDHFTRLFDGEVPGFHGVDTVYHDRQHTLDITLAAARLIVGYERKQASLATRLGGERAVVGLLTALFHDVGYLRRWTDTVNNGAELTRHHVSRGANFLAEYLPEVGLDQWVAVSTEIVHFTGYERPFSQIAVNDPLDLTLGHLVGTADLIAQMADRCYLEKCRDRLYPEFVLGGMALPIAANGNRQVRYASGLDVLRQTPDFMMETRRKRLDGDFGAAYRHLEILFGGRNPYIEAIERNYEYICQVLRSEKWGLLRRKPPLFSAVADPMSATRELMIGYLTRAWATR
jgi:hypothetical protein